LARFLYFPITNDCIYDTFPYRYYHSITRASKLRNGSVLKQGHFTIKLFVIFFNLLPLQPDLMTWHHTPMRWRAISLVSQLVCWRPLACAGKPWNALRR